MSMLNLFWEWSGWALRRRWITSSNRWRDFSRQMRQLWRKKENIWKIIDKKKHEASWKVLAYKLKCRLLQTVLGETKAWYAMWPTSLIRPVIGDQWYHGFHFITQMILLDEPPSLFLSLSCFQNQVISWIITCMQMKRSILSTHF